MFASCYRNCEKYIFSPILGFEPRASALSYICTLKIYIEVAEAGLGRIIRLPQPPTVLGVQVRVLLPPAKACHLTAYFIKQRGQPQSNSEILFVQNSAVDFYYLEGNVHPSLQSTAGHQPGAPTLSQPRGGRGKWGATRTHTHTHPAMPQTRGDPPASAC